MAALSRGSCASRLAVTAGTAAASGGKSHSWVRPVSRSPSPSAKTISVALGSSDTMPAIRPPYRSGDQTRAAVDCRDSAQRHEVSMRDTNPTPNELQRALLGYDPAPLETALIDWTRENWPMAARGMVYAKSEAADTVKGVPGVRTDESRLVLEVAARVAIAE